MRKLFNPDNPVMRALGTMADLMILNVAFLIFSVPVVTIGPAITALYSVTFKMRNGNEGSVAVSFFKAFRQNFKQGLIIWLMALLVGVILVFDIQVIGNSGFELIIRIVTMIVSAVYLMTLVYVFPLLARFNNSVIGTIRNAAILAVGTFPRTIAALALPVACVALTVSTGTAFMYAMPVWLLLGFSGIVYANSILLGKTFDQITPK